MSKPPFIERQERRRQIERLRAEEADAQEADIKASTEAELRFLRDIHEATQLLATGSLN